MNNTFDKNIIRNGGVYKSCFAINNSINLWTDGIYFCCGSVNNDGIMIHPCIEKLNFDSKIDNSLINKIFEARVNLIEKVNLSEDNPCKGCRHINEQEWAPLNEKSNINFINVHVDHLCNCNCTYCFQDHSERNTYDANKVVDVLLNTGIINFDHLHSMDWAGGEPTISPIAEQLFQKLELNEKAKHPCNIFTSGIKFSSMFVERLNKIRDIRMVISIDSGTKETYSKIKRVDQFHNVLNNLKKYHNSINNKSRLYIKYIMVEENSSETEIDNFIQMIIDNNLTDCGFYLANDIYHQELADKIKAGSYYFALQMLKRIGKMPELWCDSIELRNKYYDKLFLQIPNLQNIEEQKAKIDRYINTYKINKIIKLIDYTIPQNSIRRDLAKIAYKIAKLIYKTIKNH